MIDITTSPFPPYAIRAWPTDDRWDREIGYPAYRAVHCQPPEPLESVQRKIVTAGKVLLGEWLAKRETEFTAQECADETALTPQLIHREVGKLIELDKAHLVSKTQIAARRGRNFYKIGKAPTP